MEHSVKHNYKEEIIVPLVALSKNFEFLTHKDEEKFIIFANGNRAKVIDWHTIHICDMEEHVQRLYNMDSWKFIKRWYDNGCYFYTAEFLHIKVQKV